jgi:hypothetical protein
MRLGKPTADNYRQRARTLLREVENSENEFTERARQLKIATMERQGTFKVDIAKLNSFEDCYVRAQFEAMQLAKDQKKERIDTIIKVLQRGLGLPEVKKMKSSIELNNARAMMAYWALNNGLLEEAIRHGEAFAIADPRSSQAEMAAVYALQAYSQLVMKKGKFEGGEDRLRMFNFARYMEDRWPKSLGGDIARHSVGLQLLREENFPEAIKKLSLITPSYSSYTIVCYQLAEGCFQAEKASLEPISSDRPGDYRKRAVLALESMPESALGADPLANYFYVSGKAKLGGEMYRYKRFQQMDDLAGPLLEKLAKLRFNEEEEKDRGARNQLRFELMNIKLFARYGLAADAFGTNDYARVVELTDPLVDAVAKDGDSQEKTNLQKNLQLGTALLMLALRSNVQLGKIERTDVVLDVLDKVSGEDGGGTKNILRLLAYLIRGQIEEVRKKGDKDALQKAVKGYGDILDKRVKKQKIVDTEFIRVLADCYSSMEKHAEAAAELEKVPAPKAGEDEKSYRLVRLALVRELRLSDTKENLKKSRTILDEAMGTVKKPNWGRTDILALKEQGQLLEGEKQYGEAFSLWSGLVKKLAPAAQKGGAAKEHFLECYFHMILCYVKVGLTKAGADERDKQLLLAAKKIVDLERDWEDFGSEASKKRFLELFAQEPALKQQYDTVKRKK